MTDQQIHTDASYQHARVRAPPTPTPTPTTTPVSRSTRQERWSSGSKPLRCHRFCISWATPTKFLFSSSRHTTRARARERACVCVCERERECVCVCLCTRVSRKPVSTCTRRRSRRKKPQRLGAQNDVRHGVPSRPRWHRHAALPVCARLCRTRNLCLMGRKLGPGEGQERQRRWRG